MRTHPRKPPHPDKTFGEWFRNPELIRFGGSWQDTLGMLREKHGAATKVGVVPSATTTYHRFS